MKSMRHVVRDGLGQARLNRIRRGVAPAVAVNLTALGKLYGTDKAGSTHPYTRHYQRHLSPLRRRPVQLLEIGVGGYSSDEGGASLRMWRSYFPRGAIHGVDIQAKDLDEPRVFTHQGSQSDVDFLEELAVAHGPFDVIIDDGSHRSDDIRVSFASLFERHVRPGGWYIIEDLATAHRHDFAGGPPGFPTTSTALIASLVDDVNAAHWQDTPRPPLPVAEVHVYDQIAFVRHG